MKRLFPAFLLGSLCLAVLRPDAAISSDRNPPSSAVYITHVTVINAETGAEVADQTVTLSNHRILKVEASGNSQVPEHGNIVPGSGKYLIPGLWDMHVHVWDHESVFGVMLANGITGVREMAGPLDARKFRADLALKKIIAPHFYLGSPLFDGHPQQWAIHSIEVNTADEARAAVDEQKHRGADFIKVYDRLSRESYFAIAEQSARRNISFAGHIPNSVSAREASAAKQKSIEHLLGVSFACSSREDELRPKLIAAKSSQESDALFKDAYDSYSEEKCTRLFADLKANGTWPVPTLSTWSALGRLNDRQYFKDERLRYFGESMRFSLDGRIDLRHDAEKAGDSAQQVAESAARELAFDQRLTGAMFRAGIPLLAGTDAGAFLSFPGFSLHDELAALVQAGVSPLGALQAATRNPALFMHATDRYGSITPGKMADLVLLDADPLRDIRNTTKISTVIYGGQVFNKTALDKIFRDAIDAAAQYVVSPEPQVP